MSSILHLHPVKQSTVECSRLKYVGGGSETHVDRISHISTSHKAFFGFVETTILRSTVAVTGKLLKSNQNDSKATNMPGRPVV